MLPPPNITGSLHMGHAFQHTLIDILIRYHRMGGARTLWQCGTDHAGIATQMVVERQLEQEGQTSRQLGRQKFNDRIWDWKKESGGIITDQLRRLGTSMDWSRERFTLDEGLSVAVTKIFIDLYQQGLIYRGERLVNWDPVLQTALSDLEVISEEEQGYMWYIKYPRCDGAGHIEIATTRPETLLGDAAVAVHPEDERYSRLVGKRLHLPLTDRTIPVIADQHIDPEFGTGCVKITPAHDFNDYEIWQRHKDTSVFKDVPYNGLINILATDASILTVVAAVKKDSGHPAPVTGDTSDVNPAYTGEIIPEKYRGMDRYKAREQIIEDLDRESLLEKTKEHKFMVPRSDRSGAVVEPYLTKQWYVDIQSLAEPAIEAVTSGTIKFIPDNWSKIYLGWMNDIQDWCISRQLWWGHRIPAWYDESGKAYVGASATAIRKDNNLPDSVNLVQDEDVLDTWFSSALWPFSTLGWPKNTLELKDFYPTSVLVTGFDIIFFWVARMIMMGLKFTGEVPFREVYVHGLVRDAQGQKMSKSKGNVLDPIDLIDGIELEELLAKRTSGLMRPKDAPRIERTTRKQFPQGISAYGTDALRITFASLASQGRDINFDTDRIGGYRNFCNKLWNASRYVIMSIQGRKIAETVDDKHMTLADRWIMTCLADTIDQVTRAIRSYRFDLAVKAIYQFAWNEYCDWYLEFSKLVLADDNVSDVAKENTRLILLNVLENLLRIAHPFIPFITEEIWQKLRPFTDRRGKTIMQEPYPSVDHIMSDQNILPEMQWLQAFISGVRRIRAQRDIPPKTVLSVKVTGGTEQERRWLHAHTRYLRGIAHVDSVDRVSGIDYDAAIELAGETTLFVALADMIDPQRELARLSRELEKLQKDNSKIERKLENQNFVKYAPAMIVKQQRQRLEKNNVAIRKLAEQSQRIQKLS